MSTMPSAALARFVVNSSWETIPEAIRHESKRALVNVFATSLAGCDDPALRAATSVFRAQGFAGACTVIGRSEGFGLLHAASLNAMAGNVFDFDDTHMPTIIHPAAPVAPTLFALAQTRRVSGRDLLTAFAVGVDVECRLGNAVSPWHYQRGWHITGTCGVFGAAVAAGRILGLDERQMLWALGNASAQSSGLVETLGSMAKSIGVGNSAANGILSALLAQQGFEGPQFPIEGPRGFLRVMGNEADIDAVVSDLGTRWELASNTYKPYPCGVVLNPVIEAALTLYRNQGVRLGVVERIEITAHPLLRERADRPHPHSGREAQVSTQHAVAAALERGTAALDDFSDEAVTAPWASALADRVAFIDDASRPIEFARLSVQLRDGSKVIQQVDAARGSLAAPLSDADLEQKLHDLCHWGGSGCDPTALAQALWSLEDAPDAGAVMALAAGKH